MWLLVLVATATGVFYQGQGNHFGHVTVRGENAVFQGHGLYRYDPAGGGCPPDHLKDTSSRS